MSERILAVQDTLDRTMAAVNAFSSLAKVTARDNPERLHALEIVHDRMTAELQELIKLL